MFRFLTSGKKYYYIFALINKALPMTYCLSAVGQLLCYNLPNHTTALTNLAPIVGGGKSCCESDDRQSVIHGASSRFRGVDALFPPGTRTATGITPKAEPDSTPTTFDSLEVFADNASVMAALSFTTTSSLTRRLTVLRDTDKTVPSSVVNRPKLTPRDPAARRREELTEPVKPLAFHLDSTFPAVRCAFQRVSGRGFACLRHPDSSRKSGLVRERSGVSIFSIFSFHPPVSTRFSNMQADIIPFFRNIPRIRKIFYQQNAGRRRQKGVILLNLKSKHAPPNPYFFEYGYW